ncbi:MAG TPA: hypothetical protein PKN61_02995 [Acidobacteriota bacterium]|jgi:hypothetical protein|nr:hypothetical protein [Acidobacteriota bacterium]HNR37978.1 hypothetical protein [Acidobacteriota bacterium]HNU00420.1 hypothetical protein [Acidobacteriota bacterium]HPB28017.1 hypothetical protein [Acidobacteriota bacterium]HQO24692.1 hypothetical protein [Acidobacteriota bacterium]
MRSILMLLSLFVLLAGWAPAGENNDYFDDAAATTLAGPDLVIAGDVATPGPVDVSRLPVRSVTVREAVLKDGQPEFVGAYRYDGYSLFDILRDVKVVKKNEAEFRPVIDLLVVVENAAGEKAVLSWGEIFYTNVQHRSLIAVRVSPVIPSHADDRWPVPTDTRLVCADDMVCARQIRQPVKITVLTCPHSFVVNRDLKPLYSPAIRLVADGQEKGRLESLPAAAGERVYPTVAYGHGMGFHGVSEIRGKSAKDVLLAAFPPTPERLRAGYLVFAAADGYRCTVAYSELFNRSDRAEFLIQDRGEGAKGGRFPLFAGPDFFVDRGVKALSEIRCVQIP